MSQNQFSYFVRYLDLKGGATHAVGCVQGMRGNIIARSARIKKLRQERLNKLQTKLKGATKKTQRRQEIKIVKKETDKMYTQEIQKKLVFLKQTSGSGGQKI